MSTNELSRFPIASLPTSDEPRGTMTAEELSRIVGRAQAELAGTASASADAQRRREELDAVQSADAAERRRLITEIRMMRRYRVNVAVDGLIDGVLFGGVALGVYHLGRWILKELRRTQDTTPALSANSPAKPGTADQSAGRPQ